MFLYIIKDKFMWAKELFKALFCDTIESLPLSKKILRESDKDILLMLLQTKNSKTDKDYAFTLLLDEAIIKYTEKVYWTNQAFFDILDN